MNANQPRVRHDRCGRIAGALLVLGVVAVPCFGWPGGLEDAISLYQDARYGEALAVLDGLDGGAAASTAAAAERVTEYRALCLLALDRGDEARAAIEKLFEKRPDYRASSREFPPRFLSVIQQTRTVMLPTLVRAEYRQGKASYDEKAYPEAEVHFRKALLLLDDRELPPAARDSLTDLRDLANGFLALIEKSRAESAPPLPPLAAGLSPDVIRGNSVYESGDTRVRPPVIVRQQLPEWRSVGAENEFLRRARARGVIEVLIDEKGQVVEARLRSPVHPLYDSRLLAAARHWQYRPATRDGAPVRFRKVIEVQLGSPETP